jgi:MinD-like ATPase involved in chromosome partitioning or flagellar assembly
MSQQFLGSGRRGQIIRPVPSPTEDSSPETVDTPRELARIKVKKPKTVRIKYDIPEDVKAPTKGIPKWKFWWNVWRNKQDPDRSGYVLVPAPNKKEQAQREEDAYANLIEDSKVELVGLSQTRQRAIVVFVNTKGNGAKTTSTIWTATGLCVETGSEVTVFDGNYASGTVAQRLGLEGELTASERIIADNMDEIGATHGSFNEQVRPNTDRVRVVGAKSLMDGPRKLLGKEYEEVIQLSHDNCDYLYVDTPNDITSEQCLALLKKADLIVFTANVGEQDSLRQLGTSMNTLRHYKAGTETKLADTVNDSVVLINNLPPGAKPRDYERYQHEVDMQNEVVRAFPGHTGPFVGIRHDRAIADARPVHWTEIQRETAQDIRQVNIAILKQLPLKEKHGYKRHTRYQSQASSDLTER